VFLRESEIGGKVARHLEPGWSLLDVGSGTGLISRYLRDAAGVEPTLTDLVFYDRTGLPRIEMTSPTEIPVPDGSFDAVMLLFVFHHMDRWEDQERLLDEVVRVARRRLIIIEDTPQSGVDRVMNTAWDWVLNLRHGVPTPFTFRSPEAWEEQFRARDLRVIARDTYRAKWPTLMTYRHTFFALEPPPRG
jgi:ubiquinone/menaquinone biosynthesis C-methylase UbiE